MARDLPAILIPYLEQVEGERFKAYKDSAGVWTDGVGSTAGVTADTVWTQDQINQHLAADLQVAVQRLNWAIGPSAIAGLNDYQYAALLSFVFNEGEKADWTIWADIRNGDLSDVPGELKKFVYAGGQVNDGLENRREYDSELWLGAHPLCAQYPLGGQQPPAQTILEV